MVLRFFISVEDSYVKEWVGIYGNNVFNRLLYLYEMDPFSGKIELVGVDRDTPYNRRKYMSWGFRDLTKEVEQIFSSKPTRIDLFTFDITALAYKNPRLMRIIKKFIRG